MRFLCFAPMYNTKKADATGAFQPEAKRFIQVHSDDKCFLVLFNNKKSKAEMRKEIIVAINTASKDASIDGVFFFCHGYRKGIQCGFDLTNVKQLANVISDASRSFDVIIALYACSTGRDIDADQADDLKAFGGDGGFADRLRDALCECGDIYCRVDSHTTAGHTTRNPNVRRFEGRGSEMGGVGGYYLVNQGSALWRKWRAALKTDFRFQFPFMTVEAIHQALSE